MGFHNQEEQPQGFTIADLILNIRCAPDADTNHQRSGTIAAGFKKQSPPVVMQLLSLAKMDTVEPVIPCFHKSESLQPEKAVFVRHTKVPRAKIQTEVS